MNTGYNLSLVKDEVRDEEDFGFLEEDFKEIVTLSDNDEYMSKILSGYGEYNSFMNKLDSISYDENRYCPRYLGDYIEKFVMQFLGGEIVTDPDLEPRRGGVARRPIDFLLDYNGEKLKIKHVAGCLVYGRIGDGFAFYWKFDIDFNRHADGFILSAWDTRRSLVPQYIWFIKKDDISFNGKPFWKRYDMRIEDRKDRISFMEKFEMKVRLGVLQNIVAHARKKDLISLLIDKQRDIYLKTGIKINLKKLTRVELLHGLKKDFSTETEDRNERNK